VRQDLPAQGSHAASALVRGLVDGSRDRVRGTQAALHGVANLAHGLGTVGRQRLHRVCLMPYLLRLFIGLANAGGQLLHRGRGFLQRRRLLLRASIELIAALTHPSAALRYSQSSFLGSTNQVGQALNSLIEVNPERFELPLQGLAYRRIQSTIRQSFRRGRNSAYGLCQRKTGTVDIGLDSAESALTASLNAATKAPLSQI